MTTSTQMLSNLQGKTAVVTGGTKGIGRAIADKLALEGAQVIVTARTKPSEENFPYHFIAADATSGEQIAALTAEIKSKFGSIDILVNNVGGATAPMGGHSTLTDEDWENELQLNLLSAIRIDRNLIPIIKTDNGSAIVHISSVAGRVTLWNLNLAYSVAKSALNTYSKALSNELVSKGIRVLTVSPGATKTPPMQQFISDFAAKQGLTYEEASKKMLEQTGGIPMGRMAEPEEVANLVHFLVSPAASYLTGSNFAIDGGSLPVFA
ncbi:SDR family oxidoreductase [Sphingobacterium corticis]|uniref:SDR family oxidoreductase n=1 Tax=Sphingobacterium corticis TaxID=1812823 RepID=A0ABW5NMH5_9SPHI